MKIKLQLRGWIKIFLYPKKNSKIKLYTKAKKSMKGQFLVCKNKMQNSYFFNLKEIVKL